MSFDSPKRKRRDERSDSPVTTPTLFTRFPPLPPDSHDDAGGSPRTKVAGKFQDLEISHYQLDRPNRLDGPPSKRTHYSDDEMIGSSQDSMNDSTSLPQQTDGPSETHTHSLVPPSQSFTFERAMSTVFPPAETPRPKSPSLKGEISDQYWHESEITGHDPDDPEDDGYGINGIGFKPTSAMAYTRTQKRKQQIAEYRSREAREARQRRSERRKIGSAEMNLKASSPTPNTPSKTRVRFEDGGKEIV